MSLVSCFVDQQLKLRPCWVYNQQMMPYLAAWQWQQRLVQARRDCPELPDVFLLLEHPPVYTLGQGADVKFLKFDPQYSDIETYRIERGGEVTYHAPGQLVGYPILNLRYYHQDLHWYLRQLEEVVMRVLATLDLPGERRSGLTGIWIGDRKVAAIGIKVSRWITMHGFALNVCPDMTGFEKIVPCGLQQPVACLTEWMPELTTAAVRPVVLRCFAEVFQVQLVVQDSDSGTDNPKAN